MRMRSSRSADTLRQDQYNYYPSNNPFADFSPTQQATIGQDRTLTNAGLRSDVTYAKGIHNIKIGANYSQTFLTENDQLGIVDPNFLASQTDANGNPCLSAAGVPIAAPCTTLAPFDLTRGGNYFQFNGHTDVKQLAMYVQDTITKKQWTFNLGIRGDLYNGLSVARQAEPRVGVAYNIPKTNTVLRASYARTLETPFNENLVLSSTGCNFAVIAALVPCVPSPLDAGLPERVPRRIAAGIRKILRRFRRVHLEVHAQRIRLQRPGEYSDLLPDRVAQLEDSGMGSSGEHAELPRSERAGGDVERGSAFLPAASRWTGRDRGAERFSVPHRS